ncbi:unnamed protein product [Protopolystoma xenopodis]|uniref:Uncharacterized protein n=1 Tax=Protopolystoma xenopodis TaxID=117903 RepID=A0A3S5AYY5_9PLAT|nr:unnamed protein product [Protopolystoma xenopodis]
MNTEGKKLTLGAVSSADRLEECVLRCDQTLLRDGHSECPDDTILSHAASGLGPANLYRFCPTLVRASATQPA